MDANWNVCLLAILAQEGGNDDDPHDPGGRTSRGIIQREYNAYRQAKHEPTRDVWQASDDEVGDIYRTSYWEPYCPDLMPNGVDLVFFDMGVNAGPVESTKLLQRALNVNDDGHIGIITRGAIARCDPKDTITRFTQARLMFYRSLRTFRYFGRGWTSRAHTIESQALRLVERTA